MRPDGVRLVLWTMVHTTVLQLDVYLHQAEPQVCDNLFKPATLCA